MSKELDALNRLATHLEKDFDSDNYIKSGEAKKDFALVKTLLERNGGLPAPEQNCYLNYYSKVAEVCEKCSKHEKCERFKELKARYDKSTYEAYAQPYIEGRYNGD